MKLSVFPASVARRAAVSLLIAVSLAACGAGDRVSVDREAAAAPTSAEAVPDSAATRPDDRATSGGESLAAAIADLRQPRDGLYTAGQPESAAWQTAAASGVTTVINLRPAAEMDGRDEAAEVAAAGLDYFKIPVAGADDINMNNARELERLIEEAPGPVLVHCASGNRVGALLALGEMERQDLALEHALAFGRSAGLSSLEPRVREVIKTTPATGCRADVSC